MDGERNRSSGGGNFIVRGHVVVFPNDTLIEVSPD